MLGASAASASDSASRRPDLISSDSACSFSRTFCTIGTTGAGAAGGGVCTGAGEGAGSATGCAAGWGGSVGVGSFALVFLEAVPFGFSFAGFAVSLACLSLPLVVGVSVCGSSGTGAAACCSPCSASPELVIRFNTRAVLLLRFAGIGLDAPPLFSACRTGSHRPRR